jgi:hypothetical protein
MSTADELERLAALPAAGALDDGEFRAAKSTLLLARRESESDPRSNLDPPTSNLQDLGRDRRPSILPAWSWLTLAASVLLALSSFYTFAIHNVHASYTGKALQPVAFDNVKIFDLPRAVGCGTVLHPSESGDFTVDTSNSGLAAADGTYPHQQAQAGMEDNWAHRDACHASITVTRNISVGLGIGGILIAVLAVAGGREHRRRQARR